MTGERTIIYDHALPDGPAEVHRLTWDETVVLAPQLMTVTADAYVAEFTHNLGVVPERDIRSRYNPEDPVVLSSFLKRTEDIHTRGSRIAVVRDPANNGALRGYMKVGPAPQLTRNKINGRYHGADGGYDYQGYYLSDIMVAPGDPSVGRQVGWNRGLGSLLLHAGFKLHDCDPELPVVLDAFDISHRVNAWYRRLGLMPEPHITTDVMEFGATVLKMTYYATPDDVALKGVLSRLETRRPKLRDYRLTTA